MVSNVTSLTGNGLKDWLIQRVTAIYLAVYTFFMLGFWWLHPELVYPEWYALFHNAWFQIATVLALFMLVLHAWIGVWTVTTDYIKCTLVRLPVQFLVAFFLLGQLFWGFMIVWGQ